MNYGKLSEIQVIRLANMNRVYRRSYYKQNRKKEFKDISWEEVASALKEYYLQENEKRS